LRGPISNQQSGKGTPPRCNIPDDYAFKRDSTSRD
jgi:hypothetical protein